MRLRSKVMGAAALSATPPLGLGAGPAAAEAATAAGTATFTDGGATVSCTFTGWSESDAEGGSTQVDVQTTMTDSDSACREALVRVRASAQYRRTGATEDEYYDAHGDGPSVGGSFIARGDLESVLVTHSVGFTCDGNPPAQPCWFHVVTDPVAVNRK